MRHDKAREIGGAGAADIRGPQVENGDERIANHLGRNGFGDASEESETLWVAELVGQIAGGSLGRLFAARYSFPSGLLPAERTLTKNILYPVPIVGFFLPVYIFLPCSPLPGGWTTAGIQHGREANHDRG